VLPAKTVAGEWWQGWRDVDGHWRRAWQPLGENRKRCSSPERPPRFPGDRRWVPVVWLYGVRQGQVRPVEITQLRWRCVFPSRPHRKCH